MTVKPYESEADREARRKAEEEKRRREEEAKGSNNKFRALDVSGLLQRGQGPGEGEDTHTRLWESKAAVHKKEARKSLNACLLIVFDVELYKGARAGGQVWHGRSRLCPLDAPRPIPTDRRYSA